MNRKLIIFASLAFLALSVWFFSDVVVYVVIATILAFMLNPLVSKLSMLHIKNKFLPRWFATIIAMILFTGIFVGFGLIFFPMLFNQIEILLEVNYAELAQNLHEPLLEFELWLSKLGVEDPAQQLEDYLRQTAVSLVDFTQVGVIINSLVGFTGSFFIGFFAVAFITFFFLKDEHLVRSIIIGATPDEFVPKMSAVISNAKRLLSRYFLGLIIQISAISTLVYLGLSIMGIQNAFLIALFAGVINVIPYVGPIIGMIFGLFVAITTNLDPSVNTQILPLLTKVMGVFLIVQTLDNFVFQPLIFSNSVMAHPIEIFLLIFIAGKLAGITGMICAIPAYSLIRIFAKEFLIQFKIVQNLTKNI